MAYHANTVPVKDNENKRTRNASVSANSPNCARNWPCVHVCSFLGHPKILRIRVSWFPGVWVVIKSAVIRFPI